jgi:glycerol uptake facilitator-like aquaporin
MKNIEFNYVQASNRLTSNQKIFFAEIIGTFIVVVLATGSVVLTPN